MKNYGPNGLLENVINKGLCIGCGACINLCPYFRSHRGKTAMLFPCTLDQGSCWAYCPKIEVDMDSLSKNLYNRPFSVDPLGYYRTVNSSKAGHKVPRGHFQAGGTVSALMYFALLKGYIDTAILTGREGLLPVPRKVTNPADVLECSSSKYTATPTLYALNQSIKEEDIKIGVVGTPCQLLAAAQIRSKLIKDKHLDDPVSLTIGLFCTWALDFRAFEAFISKRMDICSIKKMDIPPPPSEVMEVYTDRGKTEIPLDKIRDLVPIGCNYCPDMTAEFSDISVGLLEGQPGMNVIITRTERGEHLLHEAQRNGYLILDEMPEENLKHLVWAAGNKRKRAFLKTKEEGLLNTQDEQKTSLMRLRPETVEAIIN